MCCSNVKFLKLEYFNNTSCVKYVKDKLRHRMSLFSFKEGIKTKLNNKVMNNTLSYPALPKDFELNMGTLISL